MFPVPREHSPSDLVTLASVEQRCRLKVAKRGGWTEQLLSQCMCSARQVGDSPWQRIRLYKGDSPRQQTERGGMGRSQGLATGWSSGNSFLVHRAASAQQKSRLRRWACGCLVVVGLVALFYGTRAPLAACVGERGGSDSGTSSGCPATYDRLTVADIRAGAKPYLLGGQAKNCVHCQDEANYISTFCQFQHGREGGICEPWLQDQLIKHFLDVPGYEALLTLTPCDLWKLLKGRTLWMSGDSQTQDFYKAVHCFLYEITPRLGYTPIEGGDKGVFQEGAVVGWYPPGCVDMPGNTRLCFIRSDDGPAIFGKLIPMLQQLAQPQDVLVINFGLHWSADYDGELRNLTAQYPALRRTGFPYMIWKDTPVQHFDTRLGEYPGGKPPFQCTKLGGDQLRLGDDHTLEILDEDLAVLGKGGWRNELSNAAMQDAGIPIIHTYNDTAPLHEYHRDNGAGHECTHHCHPSGPQVWVHALYQTLSANQDNIAVRPLPT
ncbi:hypothetical protein WJX72_006927 [[Myrmecia] bisecta]|uniref:Uncharacterized protein n=1 Tax=[Myrmecia] bisecta TaxID=41462 RepID=A0AAW1PHK7_9CHLO